MADAEALAATERLHAMLEGRVFIGSPTRSNRDDEDQDGDVIGGDGLDGGDSGHFDLSSVSTEGSLSEGENRDTEIVMCQDHSRGGSETGLEESLEEAMMATEILHRNMASVRPSTFARPASPPPSTAFTSQRIVSFADIDLADFEIDQPVSDRVDGIEAGEHDIDTLVMEESTELMRDEQTEEDAVVTNTIEEPGYDEEGGVDAQRRDARRRIEWDKGWGGQQQQQQQQWVQSDIEDDVISEHNLRVASEASADAVSTVASVCSESDASATIRTTRPAGRFTKSEEQRTESTDEQFPYRREASEGVDVATEWDHGCASGFEIDESVSTLLGDDDDTSRIVANVQAASTNAATAEHRGPALPPRCTRSPRTSHAGEAAPSTAVDRTEKRAGRETVDRAIQVGCHGIGTQVSFDEDGRFLYDADDLRSRLMEADFLQRFRGDAVRNIYAHMPAKQQELSEGKPDVGARQAAATASRDLLSSVENDVSLKASELRYRQRLECIRNRLALLSSS